MQIELHQLELRYQALRAVEPSRRRKLLSALCETGQQVPVVVVAAPDELQRARAFERPGMSEGKLAAILANQVPDDEKRRRADFVVDTSQGFEHARAQVRDILARVATMPKRPR